MQCFQSSPSACAVPALQPAVCLHRAQHAPLPHAQRPTSQANGTPTSPTGATPAGKSHHKATLPHAQRPTSQANGTPTSATGATPAGKSHHKATAMAQGIPAAAAMASYRRSRLPFDRLQTPKMPRRPFAMLPILRRPVAPSPVAFSPCCSSVAAAAMASYRRSRLPFDRLQTPKMPQRPFAMLPILRRPVAPSPVAVSLCCSRRVLGSVQANGTPTSPTGATPAGKSHHKATAMAQGIPPAAAMASYRRSRLPFDRLQTPKMPRRPFAMLPILAVSPCCSSVAACRLPAQSPTRATPARTGKRYPNKRNRRHARRQKPPQGHSNGSRHPPGRSNGLL